VARVFLVAVALAGIALALKSVLVTRGLTDPTYLLFFPAVAASAWYGGVWPGVLTTLLCGVGEAVVFQAPIGSPGLVDTADQIRMALFAVAGGTVSLLTGLLRAARTGAERTREQLRLTVAAQEQARVEAEHVAARLDVVSGVASALASAVTADDVGNAVLTAASRTVGTHAGAVAVTSDAGDALLTISTLGYPPEVLASTRRIPLDAPVPIADAARSRQPLWFESERALRDAYPAIASYPHDRYDGSMAVLPLTADDRLVGAMWLRFPEPRTFTADDRSFIVALAQQCAQALDRARLFEAERRTRNRRRGGRAAAGAPRGCERGAGCITGDRTQPRGGGTAGRRVARRDRVGRYRPRDGCRRARGAGASGRADRGGDARARRAERPVDLSLPSPLATVLRTGEPVLVPDISAIKPPDEAHAQVLAELRELRIHSLVTVPLLASGTPFGTLSVASTDPAQPLGERQLTFMEDLARRIASAVETSRLYRELDQFKGTVDASLDAIFMFDPRTLRFLYVNDGAVAQLGYPRDQLLGMRALDIEPNFDEDGYRDLIGSLSGGSQASHTFTTVHRRLDGREIPVEVFLQASGCPAARP
jgi:PAS domain S-box-containing protein